MRHRNLLREEMYLVSAWTRRDLHNYSLNQTLFHQGVYPCNALKSAINNALPPRPRTHGKALVTLLLADSEAIDNGLPQTWAELHWSVEVDITKHEKTFFSGSHYKQRTRNMAQDKRWYTHLKHTAQTRCSNNKSSTRRAIHRRITSTRQLH